MGKDFSNSYNIIQRLKSQSQSYPFYLFQPSATSPTQLNVQTTTLEAPQTSNRTHCLLDMKSFNEDKKLHCSLPSSSTRDIWGMYHVHYSHPVTPAHTQSMRSFIINHTKMRIRRHWTGGIHKNWGTAGLSSCTGQMKSLSLHTFLSVFYILTEERREIYEMNMMIWFCRGAVWVTHACYRVLYIHTHHALPHNPTAGHWTWLSLEGNLCLIHGFCV